MSKPKPVQTPFAQQQQQSNTYGTQSIANTPEAQSLLSAPLDFGSNFNVDPGVGRRTDLAEQELQNRYNSAFMGGVPSFIRERNRDAGLRQIRSQGAAEAQQAEYGNQQLRNQATSQQTMADLARRERLLPQIVQTGGSSTGSGFNSQIPQGGGFLNTLIGGAARVGAAFA